MRGEDQVYPSSRNRYIIDNFRRHFRDPDGDPLRYAAASSNDAVVTAGLSIVPEHPLYQAYGSAIGVGGATVTITATDPHGLVAEQSFDVSVGPPIPNRAPTVQRRIPRTTVFIGANADSIRLRNHFDDNDLYGFDFDLLYTVSTANTSVARSRLEDKRDPVTRHGFARLVTSAVGKGRTTTTVTATDRLGLSAELTFDIVSSTRPPTVRSQIGDQSVRLRTDETIWDVQGYFADPDGPELVIGASSSDTTVIRTRVRSVGQRYRLVLLAHRGRDQGGHIIPTMVGTAEVTVTATDPTNESVSQTFTVTVTEAEDLSYGGRTVSTYVRAIPVSGRR